ncbi:MAG TPA: nuclear transport factor 2 family protein [Herpetosiphonaceae bacterium]|nr:nuclear transport factor 2 family protein [Herpetosiphonaceae bacterium]
MEYQEQARRFIEALHALEGGDDGGLDRICGLFSDDAVLTNAALRLADKEYRGRSGVREFWQAYRGTFAAIRSEFSHVTAGDGAAGLFWSSAGQDASGQPVSYDGVSLLEFDQSGRIARFRGYYDTRQLVSEVGGR